ncbi:MAG: GNAT family N-acetyltransferase [Candidatus Thorarchaeota archaeon]|jgi:predicted N-acetyltransferase YhbS
MTDKAATSLPDGLEFGIVETDDELEELIKFNSSIHEPNDGEELRRIIDLLPGFSREMNFYIRDTDKGLFVSSINAIPSVWGYAGIPLRNLELGFVGTLPEYRKRGLVRALYKEFFEKALRRGKYQISNIQGIPYYYRQFGYDFLIPAWRSVFLRTNQVPEVPPKDKPAWKRLTIRRATKSNLDSIIQLYDEMIGHTLVSTIRDRKLWQIQEQQRREYEKEFTTYVVKRGREVEGYFRLVARESETDPGNGFLDVIENSIRTYDGVRRTLQFLKEQCKEKNLNRIALSGAINSNLSQVGIDLSGHMSRGWKHQLRIPDMISFLNRIRPALQKRLRGTMFDGLTQEVTINTYRHCYVLDFRGGKIQQITDLGIHEDGKNLSFRAPPNDFVRLLFGQYSIEELNRQNIDFIVRGEVKSLIATLFPKQESFIGYYYC